MRCWAAGRGRVWADGATAGPSSTLARNGLRLPLAGATVHPPTPVAFDGAYQEVRSQGPVDCSTAPVAKKSWATAMA